MAKEEVGTSELFAEEPRIVKKKIVGLGIALVGIVIVLLLTILRILNPNSLDPLEKLLQAGSIPGLMTFISNFGNFIGYAVAIAALVIVILYYIKSMKAKVAPYAKYAGLVVLTFAFSVGLVGFLLEGLQTGNSNLNLWYALFHFSTWPAFSLLVAGSTFTVPLCFNRPKTRVYEILTLVGAIFYNYIVITSTIGLFYSVFDIIWGIFIPVALGGFFYKSILSIPDQERWDTDNYVLTPMHDAYKRVLMAKAILENRPIKVTKQVDTPEGVKEEIFEEIPSGDPEDLVKQAIRLYSETETIATQFGRIYAREVRKSQIWQKRLARLLEERQLVDSGELDEILYKQRWLYIF